MRPRRRIVAVALLVALGACGTSRPVQYYGLDALDVEFKQDSPEAPILGIGPLRYPDYMARSQIVTRGAAAEYRFDDFNRWAEPLGEAVYRVATANVDSILDDVIVVAFPYSHLSDLTHQLVGRIDGFLAASDGSVVFELQWGIVTPENEVIVAPRRARYSQRIANPDDYNEVAAAMSEVLAEFSREIAREYKLALEVAAN